MEGRDNQVLDNRDKTKLTLKLTQQRYLEQHQAPNNLHQLDTEILYLKMLIL